MQPSEFALEHHNDIPNGIKQLREAWHNRLMLENPKLRERYLRGILAPHLHVRTKFDSDRHRNICICVKHDLIANEHGRMNHVLEGAHNEQQFLMLFGNVHLVEDGQQIGPRLGGIIGLQPLDFCLNRKAKALYFSVVTFHFVFLSGGIGSVNVNRELDSRRMGDAVRVAGKLPSEMVKRGTQLMDDLAHEYTEPEWYRSVEVQLKQLAKGLHVIIGDASINAVIEKNINFPVEVLDVLFGPF